MLIDSFVMVSILPLAKKTKSTRGVFYSVILFVALYSLFLNPAFTFLGGLHMAIFLWPLTGFLIFKNIRRRLYIHKNVMIAWLIAFAFVLFRTLLGGDYIFISRYITLMIESILVSYVLIILSFRFKVNVEKALLITSSIAGVISCICLIVPSINEFTKSLLVIDNDYLLVNDFRGFGIGDGFTFSYGAVLGLICSLGICRISDYKWFVFFIPIICAAIMINARSGIIPVLLAFPLFLLSSRKFSTLLYTLLAVIIIVLLFQFVIVNYVPDETLQWAILFFTEMMEGKEGGTVDALQSMRVLPEDTMEWVLGTGLNAFNGYHGKRTDVGYQIQLFYGGIVYLVLFFNLIFQLIKTAKKAMPRIYLITIVLTLLLFNYKGELIANRMSFTLFVFLMIYYAQVANMAEDEKAINRHIKQYSFE